LLLTLTADLLFFRISLPNFGANTWPPSSEYEFSCFQLSLSDDLHSWSDLIATTKTASAIFFCCKYFHISQPAIMMPSLGWTNLPSTNHLA
jgi:hypothetical protein